MLDSLIGQEAANFLRSINQSRYLEARELDQILDIWSEYIEVKTIGHSRSGHPIRMACFPGGDKKMLAWGFPHPDEPLGANALMLFGQELSEGKLPSLDEWSIYLVLVADPDEANRQTWQHQNSAESFVKGVWRPTHMGWEVDYGFPMDWENFYQPEDFVGRVHDPKQPDQEFWDKEKLPFGPLPESKALAHAIETIQPDLVFAMHSTHTGGDYTFLLERESKETLQKLVEIPGAVGNARHLGESIDRGRKWTRSTPDLFVEPDLEFFDKRLKRHKWFNKEYAYYGNHSAAAFIQSILPKTQFVCPEATQFRNKDFESLELVQDKETILISIEDGKKNRYRYRKILIDGEWVVFDQEKVDPKTRRTKKETELRTTRSMLGVRALYERRKTLARADEVWDSIKDLEGLREHPYWFEKLRTKVPGAYVNDGSMRIFRSDIRYRQTATKAARACFVYRWPMHTATLLGNFQNFLAVQDESIPEIKAAKASITALQMEIIQALPLDMQTEGDPSNAMQSMLGRMFVLMQANSK